MKRRRGTAARLSGVRTRCRHHTSVVPRLTGVMGTCTGRRGRAFRRIAGTHTSMKRMGLSIGGLARTDVGRCTTTRNRLTGTFSGLVLITRECPRLGTDRGFGTLRIRRRNARGQVDRSHHGCGRTMRSCGRAIEGVPGTVVTNVFGFGMVPGFRTTTNTRGTPSLSV